MCARHLPNSFEYVPQPTQVQELYGSVKFVDIIRIVVKKGQQWTVPLLVQRSKQSKRLDKVNSIVGTTLSTKSSFRVNKEILCTRVQPHRLL